MGVGRKDHVNVDQVISLESTYADATVDMYQQEAIDTQQCHDKFRDVANASTSMTTAHPLFNCFRSFDEIASFLDRLLLSSRPSNRHLLKVPIASTVQGHPIFGYHWTKPSKGRALLYIQAGVHPREWVSISSLVYAMVKLISSPSSKALDDWDIVFVPVVNVDGYKLTWSAPANRLWRKNARGIDLNRNFGPASYFTATNDTTSETYSGPYAMSEPETKGIAAYLESIQSRLRGTLDVHTTAGVVVRPLSVSNAPLQGDDEASMSKVGEAVASAMNNAARSGGGSSDVPYTSIAGHELYQGALYSGTFKDMVYLSLNRTPSLTIELRGESGFMASSGSIRRSGDELVEAIGAFASQLH
ncbi:hypothetical protein H257_13112 [Aphanomyces astaci]|uniref:Peptidase M14 domain-containing protein n=1 Tax=Aphanomyces astaci TaxID=112090 RepID=W4FY17_APHAT|nr:hypothetical protein H257_13112 [Aphanomyces astaci]ETV71674.1 hypothetical protein H257_13112 [Aphanomyces astaci]|eukprot:XP_009838862.1 hypothetical protein H257_13112 [Aphanomyces astaci]